MTSGVDNHVEDFPLEAELNPHIGRTLKPVTHWATPETIAKFSRAIGATDPVHFDEVAATAAGHHAIVAPASYYLSIRIGGPQVRPLADLGADGMPEDEIALSEPHRAMAGETSVSFLADIYAGDTITMQRTLKGVRSKKGSSGVLTMLTFGHTLTNQDGVVVVEEDYVRILL